MDKKRILAKVGAALYGERWQTDLARDLGLSDGRRIRQWLSGERPVPDGLNDDLVQLLQERKKIIEHILMEFHPNQPE